jgi:hypothetical protein
MRHSAVRQRCSNQNDCQQDRDQSAILHDVLGPGRDFSLYPFLLENDAFFQSNSKVTLTG